MSLALAQPMPAPARSRDGACRATGDRRTLDDVVSSAWAGLAARAPVACPLCGGRMVPSERPTGTCRSCGASLS